MPGDAFAGSDRGLLLVVGGWGGEFFAGRSGRDQRLSGFQDLRQPLDTLIGIGVARLEIGYLALQGSRASARANTMAFSASTSSGTLRSGGVIGSTRHILSRFSCPFRLLIHFAAGLT